MQRSEGRFLFDPGAPSITNVYHDINDFYYSGHLGTITLMGMEYYCQGHKCMTIFCLFLAVYSWMFMLITRTHYIIDLIAGVLIGHWAFM